MKHLLLPLIAAISLTACDATQIATPEEAILLKEQDARIEVLEAEIETAETKWKGAIAELKAIGTQFDVMARADFDEAVSFAASVADAAQADYASAAEAWDLETGVQDVMVQGMIDRVGEPIIPFLPPGLPQFIPMVLPFLFDRPRKHLGKTAQHAMKLDLANVLKSVGKMSGVLHSDTDEQPPAA